MGKAQSREIAGLEAALDGSHEQIPQLCAEPSGGQCGPHVLGPVRGLALARGVTGEQLSQDDVLLRPAEQPGAGVPAQRSRLAQDAEAEGLVGPRKRFGRGAADPVGDAVAQIRGRCPRGGQDQALIGRDPVTADPVDHDLDGRGRLAGARGAQDAQHGSGDGAVGNAAVGDGSSLCMVQARGRGGQTGSPPQCQHRPIPSRRTDSVREIVARPAPGARMPQPCGRGIRVAERVLRAQITAGGCSPPAGPSGPG